MEEGVVRDRLDNRKTLDFNRRDEEASGLIGSQECLTFD